MVLEYYCLHYVCMYTNDERASTIIFYCNTLHGKKKEKTSTYVVNLEITFMLTDKCHFGTCYYRAFS